MGISDWSQRTALHFAICDTRWCTSSSHAGPHQAKHHVKDAAQQVVYVLMGHCSDLEPRKGGFSKGGFCRVQCHGQRSKKYPKILAPAVHLASRAPQPREAYILQNPLLKTPFSWFLIRDGETTIKIEVSLLSGGGGHWGQRGKSSLKMHILLSKNLLSLRRLLIAVCLLFSWAGISDIHDCYCY